MDFRLSDGHFRAAASVCSRTSGHAASLRQRRNKMKRGEWTLVKTGLVAGLTALAAITTMLIRVPIPATTGYFNIGDVFVIFAGLWLGPIAGLVVGAVGPTIADVIGFPVFVPATLVTKGLEGFLVGLIAGSSDNFSRKVVAAVVGGITIVVGYFVFEAFIYPALGEKMPIFAVTDIGAAIVEVVPNLIQAAVGAVGGLALWRVVAGRRPQETMAPRTSGG